MWFMSKQPPPLPPIPDHIAEKTNQEYFQVAMRRAFTPEERKIIEKALLSYAAMTPLEPGHRILAESICKKLGF